MYADTLFLEENPPFAPVASWVTNNQQERPHIMLTLRHDATVDERLLRGELLTIVAAMNSRLSFRYFKRHVIAPVRIIFWAQPLSILVSFDIFILNYLGALTNLVLPSSLLRQIMVFSFMNHCRGRIIQGYYDGHEVVLRKSKLFDFSNAETAPFDLFVRHLASAPVGDTEKLPERLPAQDAADGDIIPMDLPKVRAQRLAIPSFEPPGPQEPRPDRHSSLPISLKGKEPELSLSPGNAPGNRNQTSSAV